MSPKDDYSEGFNPKLRESLRLMFAHKEQGHCDLCGNTLFIVLPENTDSEKLVRSIHNYHKEELNDLKQRLEIRNSKYRFWNLFIILTTWTFIFKNPNDFQWGMITLTILYAVFYVWGQLCYKHHKKHGYKKEIQNEIESLIQEINN